MPQNPENLNGSLNYIISNGGGLKVTELGYVTVFDLLIISKFKIFKYIPSSTGTFTYYE